MDELTDDAIAGEWRVLQRRRGHRYSLDDVVTAWEAAHAMPRAKRYADLGCGIGSVLLMVAYKLDGATLAAVEAQDVSHDLARRNIARAGLDVELVHGDLREPGLFDGARFDLVTGTPPYLEPHTASPSTDAQRTYARIEMRGGIEDYLAAASKILADDGRFVACCDARRPERAIEGARAAGLSPVRKRDVIPRAKKGPLFTVWTFARDGELVEEPPLIARDENGGRTAIAHDLRRFFDLPVNENEAPSPGKRAS